MREIKFRGKNKHTQNLVYGDLIHKCGKTYIGYWAKDDSPSGNGYIECEVIPETVGQYTGLKDCCGKEIYEDDIVKIGYTAASNLLEAITAKGVIKHVINAFELHDSSGAILEWPFYKTIVVGNIFDNPELLEMTE